MTTLTVGDLGKIYATAEARQRDGVRVTICGINRSGYDAHGQRLPLDPRERQPSGLDFSRARFGLYLGGVRVVSIEWARDALLESEPYYAPVTRATVLEVGPPAPRHSVSRRARHRRKVAQLRKKRRSPR